MTHNKKYQISS